MRTWKEVIRRELDPTKGMMQNKLKLTKGHISTMVKYVTASRSSSVVFDFEGADAVHRRSDGVTGSSGVANAVAVLGRRTIRSLKRERTSA